MRMYMEIWLVRESGVIHLATSSMPLYSECVSSCMASSAHFKDQHICSCCNYFIVVSFTLSQSPSCVVQCSNFLYYCS